MGRKEGLRGRALGADLSSTQPLRGGTLPDLLTQLQSSLGDRYVVQREIGHGGMATVFQAQDLKHGRSVAVKVLNPELAAVLGERFLREINISAQLHHPHILPLHDSGAAEGFLYYVMPLVEGESLRDRLVREKQLPLEDALQITSEMADALAYAHSRGVVHRDIKPENILLQAGHALLADFGIAQAITAAGEQRLTQTGLIIGTPPYMSPEQASGESHLDAQTDVYSLGCVLYEMLAGAPPYAGPTAQAIQARRLTEPVPPIRTIRDAVPGALDEIVLKALARAPADRWPSVSEFADALRHAGASAGRGSRLRVRPRYIAALTVVALAVPVVVGWFIAHRRAPGACPDGSPPPCAGWSPRPVTATPPTSELARARAFLVLPFRDLSPAAEHQWLIEASPTMLADALGQWTEVTVVPDERLYPALRRHGLVPGSVMDLSLVGLVAAETAGWTAVIGEVLGLPDRIRVSARAYDVVTQRLVARPSVEIGRADDIRGAYEQIATALLHGAGLDQASADLGAATTRSLDAYRAYLRAVAHLNHAEYQRAREALLEAVHLDSTFAQAYAKLAEVSLLAFSVLEPDHPAYGYAERAAALSGRLPPRAASHVRALHSLLSADFTAARGEVESLVARDSNDVDALEALASLEFLDPLLVATPAGVRRRGSLNAAVRLARRVLSLDPTRHGAYQGLVTIYSLAGGQPPGAVAGYRREQPRPVRSSVRAWCSCDFEIAPPGPRAAGGNDSTVAPATPFAGPDVMFVPLLRDSLELVPVGLLRTIGRESLEAARARARAAARAWAQRWLAVGPGEAEAHRAAARVHELDGALGEALRELDTADSLGVEAEAEAVSARRMILLGKLGRFDDARRIADSLWQARYFSGDLFSTVPAMTEAYAWATNLFAAAGDFLRARALLTAFSARLAVSLEPAPAYAATVAVLSGSAGAPNAPVVLPDGLRLAVRKALRAEQVKHPGDPLLRAWLRTLSAAFPGR